MWYNDNNEGVMEIAKTKKHDTGYKGIFAKKRHFLHFLKKYVKAEWVGDITEKDLTPVNTTFVDEEYQNRESDVIYKVKLKGTEIIFYVLLELQSTVDYTMPFRLLRYIVELMKREFDNTPTNEREAIDFRLPAVVPIILYNGADNWTAARCFKEYLKGHEWFGEYTVDFRYFLFDLNRATEETLLSTNHLLDIVFALDQKASKEKTEKMLKVAFDNLKNMSDDDRNELFGWIRHIHLSHIADENAKTKMLDKFERGEIATMTYGIDLYIAEEIQKGIQEGIQKCEELARKKSEAAAKKANKEKLEIAKSLLDILDVETVAEKFNMTVDEVEKLKRRKRI